MSNNLCRAAIFSLAGPELTAEERTLFARANPLGFILFARNVQNPDQLRTLTMDLRAVVGRDCPILIDQEGGRVQRLRPPHWTNFAPMQSFEQSGDLEGTIRQLARELVDVGINVDCAPVLDVLCPQTHDVIGDRAFSDDPVLVAARGRTVCEFLLAENITPVIKHIPGHGRAQADSHHDLPVVDTPLLTLQNVDFAPFRALAQSNIAPHLWAMTAHVVYTALDPDHPATVSRTVIADIIRQDIGFKGFLIGDDVDMKALSRYGDVAARAQACLEAGCDAVLYCSGTLEDMHKLAESVPFLGDKALERLHLGGRFS
ncbi:MAG: beta-N-acetylhexosaminidase [Alphaproteobacteria bacterium]|nr:beta-N-acetylhexosaminidase [Alphaproteobacteria bacterium]